MLKVGITGGIGSGKSVVCSIFGHLGIPVFYADKEANVISNTNPQIRMQLIGLFGDSVIGKDGLPDRKKLRELIFQNPEAREKINALIHPFVRRRFLEWCSEQEQAPFVIEEAAILFESGANKDLDKFIMVMAPEALRIKRAMKRDNLTEAQVRSVIKSQMDESLKAMRCDYILINDDDHLLLPQVTAVYSALTTNDSAG